MQSTVPPSYVPAKKMISSKTSKRSPTPSVPSPYIRKNKKTISASKNSTVPQSHIREAISNKNSSPDPSINTTIQDTNIPITIDHFSSQNKYFSLFYTVASRKILVEIISPKQPSTNNVETLVAYETISDDPT